MTSLSLVHGKSLFAVNAALCWYIQAHPGTAYSSTMPLLSMFFFFSHFFLSYSWANDDTEYLLLLMGHSMPSDDESQPPDRV